jgi:hypothetical protein
LVIAEHHVVAKQSLAQPGGVKLELHKSDTRVLPDEVRGIGIRIVENVCVGVGIADIGEVRLRLRIAHVHAKPKGKVQLEIPGTSGAILFELDRGIFWDPEQLDARIARTGLV